MISQNSKFTWIVLISILILPAISTAQTLTNKERRNMNLKLLNAIEIYESASTIQDANAAYDFIDLFESDDSRIYCDLLDYTSEDHKISVSEYVNLLSEKKFVEISLKDLQKSAPFYKDGAWHTNIIFQKKLNYLDKNGVWFSSDEYYGAEYNISIEFVYNPQDQSCYIADINGSIPSSKGHLPSKFFVVQDSPKRTKPIYFTQKDQFGAKITDSLRFNSFQQTFINNPEGLQAWSDNVHIKDSLIAQNGNYDLIKLTYKKHVLRTKIYYAMAIGDMFTITSKDDNIKIDNNSAWEFGVDLGVTFGLGRGSQMGFYSGVGMQQSNIKLTLSKALPTYILSNSYTPTPNNNFNKNEQGDHKEYKYSITGAEETIDYTNIIIPAYLEFEHRFGKNIYFTWGFGGKFYINKSAKDLYTISGNRNDVSFKDKEYTEFLFPTIYSLNSDFKASISAIATAGFDINLYKKHIFLSIKASYERGFADVHSSNFIPYFKDGYFYPLIPSEDEDKATRSLLSCVTISRQTIWIKSGLTFKF